ncbi:MAG: YdcF family protein [Chloroflexi bacterium]|nr:YdcF family protein [Chloroflexota bacterium]
MTPTYIEAVHVDELVQVLWDYLLVNHELRQADCILVLGSHDIRVADYAIELYRAGYAPYLLFSGGVVQRNASLDVFWDATEAEVFARLAREKGVAHDRILIENRSTNTGENIRFSRRLIESMGLDFRSFILAQKPYMERRVLATVLKQWGEGDYIVTSPPLSCAEYLNGDLPREAVIQHIVGDFQRVKVYGENGFQAPQEIPAAAWDAFERLVALGYDERLVEA